VSATTRIRHDPYPSRNSQPPSITERLDPVVHGTADGPLDGDLVTTYAEEGAIVLEGLLAPSEVAEINREVDRLAADGSLRDDPRSIIEPDSGALRSLFEVHRLDGPLRELAGDPRLAG